MKNFLQGIPTLIITGVCALLFIAAVAYDAEFSGTSMPFTTYVLRLLGVN